MTSTKPLSQEEYDTMIREEVKRMEALYLVDQAEAEARQQRENDVPQQASE